MNKNKIVLPLLLISCLTIHSQTQENVIKKIRKDFKEINADTTLKKISLDSEEFLDHVPDGGGELTGFFKGDSIVKIVEWIGLSYGHRMREYYYKHDELFFIFEKFESFVEKNGELDHENAKTSFEGRYYFANEKLVEQKTSGKRPFEDNDADILKELQQEARDNFQLLLSRHSKEQPHSQVVIPTKENLCSSLFFNIILLLRRKGAKEYKTIAKPGVLWQLLCCIELQQYKCATQGTTNRIPPVDNIKNFKFAYIHLPAYLCTWQQEIFPLQTIPLNFSVKVSRSMTFY